jgi:hypothetical protein
MNSPINVGTELPPPVSETVPEQTIPAVELNPAKAISPLQQEPNLGHEQPLMQLNTPLNQVNTSSDDKPVQSSQSNNLVADDGDLIEKEWVTKLKSIIASTREDPYKQSEEITALKADYLQKRYNKTLKQSV